MKIPFKELIQLSKEHNQIWPADLVEDLEESDPHISLQSETYGNLISAHKKPQTNQVQLPTLVVPGWNDPARKGKKNWADFENLIFFYTIGKLAITNTPENQAQKERDLKELRHAIEEFLPLKGQRRKTAEERVAVNTTYLDFGKRTIDNLIKNDPSAHYELRREILDAEKTNYFNAIKLETSYTIALYVFSTLKNRYY